MAQIIEDYCSFETSKLLKEKGFDAPCKNYYSLYTEDVKHNLQKKYGAKKNWNSFALAISRPSQSLVMKWLREVHNLVIEPYRTACGYLYTISSIPYGSIKHDNFDAFDGDDEDSGQWTTWEKACEDGIRYCLEKLI